MRARTLTRQRNTHPHEIPDLRPPGEDQLRNRAHKFRNRTTKWRRSQQGGLQALAQLRQLRQERALRANRGSTVCAQSFSHPDPAISRLTSHRRKRKCPGTVAGLRSVARKNIRHEHALRDDRSTTWTTFFVQFRETVRSWNVQLLRPRSCILPHTCMSVHAAAQSACRSLARASSVPQLLVRILQCDRTMPPRVLVPLFARSSVLSPCAVRLCEWLVCRRWALLGPCLWALWRSCVAVH